MRTIIVFEDSTRANFGGGQKMTLMVCDILKEKYHLRFVDFTDTSRYAQMVKEQYGDDSLVNIGHGTIKGYSGLWTWIKMTIITCLSIISDTKKVLDGLNLSDCMCYSTNKRGLFIAALLKWRYKIPYIHHAHLVENPSAFYFRIAKRLFKGAEAVLCVSNTVLASINTPNCKLVYNPSLNNRGYKGIKTDNKFAVAFVGSLISIKGIEFFVDAAKMSPEDIEFRIYGEGALRQSLEQRACGRVKFMGFDKDVISRYYEDVDIVVVPTIIQEALSLVVVDAKSVGIPCIVTTPGGQAEIIHDGVDGFHVPMRDAKEIAADIVRITGDLSGYNNMALASYNSFESFKYAHFHDSIITIFNY